MSRLTVNDLDKVAYSPWELCGIDTDCVRDCKDCPINEIYLKLAHYEDLEEQGRLIELPCKLGDTVWTIRWWDRKVETKKIDGKTWFREINEHKVTKGKFSLYDIDKVGEYVFLTKAEAEAKLTELKEGGGDDD